MKEKEEKTEGKEEETHRKKEMGNKTKMRNGLKYEENGLVGREWKSFREWNFESELWKTFLNL